MKYGMYTYLFCFSFYCVYLFKETFMMIFTQNEKIETFMMTFTQNEKTNRLMIGLMKNHILFAIDL